MKYMGSKNRIAKYILPIMLAERKINQWWVEPFVGGGNIIDKVNGKRIGADKDQNVINALISIRDFVHELPKNNKEFTENNYKKIKTNKYKHNGYLGFSLSYGGKWLGGWRRDIQNKRDYVKEAYNNALKQSPKLQGVKFLCCDYNKLLIPKNSIIYCDPPYENTEQYKIYYKNKFDHNQFWNWCREKSKEGHTVFVSEYNAPSDFVCVWEKEIASSLGKNTGSKRALEKLFKFKG